MSKHRKPGSSSDKPSGPNPPRGTDSLDDEFLLDEPSASSAGKEEYGRSQPRPRLPDQRRDKVDFELGGPTTGPKEEPVPPSFSPDLFESNAPSSVGAGGWEPATPDEIENYDLSGGTAPPPPPKTETPPPVAPAAPPERKAAQEVEDIEEFIARSATDAPASEKTARVRRPYSLTEKVCFGAGAAVILMLLFWLGHAVVSAADGGQVRSRPLPDLPMKGSLLTVTQAATGWRKSVPNADRLEQIEVIFPAPGHFEPGIIPEVSFAVDGSAGFLRFIFRDSEGKARGDTRVVQITGGKPVEGAAGLSGGGGEAKVYCSSGLFDVDAFKAYTGDDKPRWSVEIAESNSYNSDDKDWKILGTFDVKNSLAE
ncbi:MAG TPA: hypothetical protein VHM91_11730 [Verrucomicrobiales bacterium]|nr:hypothetical protein [Verrucomicrobiales bacterium]